MKRKFKKRNKEIYLLREQGLSFTNIGASYDLSGDRIRQIYLEIKEKKEKWDSMSFLEKRLSNRCKKILINKFRDENILKKPEIIADAGLISIADSKNMGPKSLKELTMALYSLGLIPSEEIQAIFAPLKTFDINMRSNRIKTGFDKPGIPTTGKIPHLGDLILDRFKHWVYSKLFSDLDNLKKFELIDHLVKPFLSFRIFTNKRKLYILTEYITRFPYAIGIITKDGIDIQKMPEHINRSFNIYISRFPNIIDYIVQNNIKATDDVLKYLDGKVLKDIHRKLYDKI